MESINCGEIFLIAGSRYTQKDPIKLRALPQLNEHLMLTDK